MVSFFYVVFQAFILAKYFNSKKVLVDSEDKKIQRVARKSLYDYLHKRMRVCYQKINNIVFKMHFIPEGWINCGGIEAEDC